MTIRRSSILPAFAALLLCACGSEADVAEPPVRDAAAGPPADAMPVTGPERRIVAFGDSLFAGYNLAEDEGYPEVLERELRAEGIDATVVDAGVSGDTTAAGRQRLEFTLDSQEAKPDLFILELGGNDLLRGLSPAETRANLTAMLETLRAREIPVLLMGMRAPPNYGPEFQQQFDAIYAELSEEYGTRLVPFFLAGVFDQPQLIQDDRIHPTAEGVATLVANTKEQVVEALPPQP